MKLLRIIEMDLMKKNFYLNLLIIFMIMIM